MIGDAVGGKSSQPRIFDPQNVDGMKEIEESQAPQPRYKRM